MHLIETGHHQVNADCDPDLSSCGVLGCPEKCFDAQVLFDPFEEQFDLPAAFVNGSDGLYWQIEVICQEDQALSSLSIKEADPSEFFRVVSFTFISAQPNGLIAAQTAGLVDWTRLTQAKSHIAFCADDKVGVRTFDSKEPVKVKVSPAENIDASSFKKHLIHEMDIMNRSVCNLHEDRYRTSQINLSVELNRSFGFAEMSPRKHRQTQINRGGVDGINNLVDVESVGVFAIKSSRLANQNLSECFVNTPVTMLVCISEISSCDVASDAHRVEMRTSPQTGFNISKTLSESDLSKSHGEKLISGSHAFTRSRHRVKLHAAIELLTMDEIGDLSKNKAAGVHPLLRMNQTPLGQLSQMRHMPFYLLAA